MSAAAIFISHVEEDESVARDLAQGLEDAGYATWYYERDSAAGASYLIQTHDAIVAARAVVLLISSNTLARPHQVTPEVVRAHESHKPIVPLLIDVTDAEYKRQQPEWRQMIGAATSVAVPAEGVHAILPRVLRGLQALGTMPSADRRAPVPRPVGVTPRAIVTGVIAGFMVLGTTVNLLRAMSPAPGSDEFNLYLGFPAVRLANVFGNGVNGVLAATMLLALWQKRADSVRRSVRKAAAAILGATLVWLVWVLAGTIGSANWRLVTPQDQSRLIVSTIAIGALSLVLPAAIYVLYRKPGQA